MSWTPYPGCEHTGFTWQGFGGDRLGPIGVDSARSCQKLPLCPMPGGFYTDQQLAKAELISNDGSSPGKAELISVGGSTPGMMYLIREKCYCAETIVAREDQNEIM